MRGFIAGVQTKISTIIWTEQAKAKLEKEMTDFKKTYSEREKLIGAREEAVSVRERNVADGKDVIQANTLLIAELQQQIDNLKIDHAAGVGDLRRLNSKIVQIKATIGNLEGKRELLVVDDSQHAQVSSSGNYEKHARGSHDHGLSATHTYLRGDSPIHSLPRVRSSSVPSDTTSATPLLQNRKS